MPDSIEDFGEVFDKFGEVVADILRTLKDVKPDAQPEDIAQKFGETLEGKLMPITPLAPNTEVAQEEADTQILSKMEQVSGIIEKQMEKKFDEAMK